MRDRLIELISQVQYMGGLEAKLADHLLAEGVIVPPVKVGQWVYVPWRWEGCQAVAMVRVEEIKFYDSQMHYMFFIDMESDDESFNQSFGGWKIGDSIGKTAFLTREEAEMKLKENSNACNN